MAEHAELLSEMTSVGRLSAAERLKHAQKRRALQLKGWAQMEKENARTGRNSAARRKNNADKKGRRPGGRKVTFPSNVMLLEAAARNDLDEVKKLLKSGVKPDLYNEDGLTALHQCCIDDFVDVVRCLLESGADVNSCDSELWTPLHAAATCGHTGLVQILVQAGANLLAVNADGNMPYDLCEDEATLELIEVVMAEQGITQEKIDECRAAKESAMLKDVRQMVERGDDLNAKDLLGGTLLHVAAANGYMSVGELLLEHRAGVAEKDADGWTPLHAASCWGQLQMVELLVAHGADLNAKSLLDETPLDVCVDEEVRAKIMELKHKHDAIMKNQDKHKSSLQRRASSASSRGKVVRRTSVNERSNLYRREHHKEAMVWQDRGRQDRQTDDEDEDRQTDAELRQHMVETSSGVTLHRLDNGGGEETQTHDSAVGNGGSFAAQSSSSFVPGELHGGGRRDRSGTYELTPLTTVNPVAVAPEGAGSDSMTRDKSHQTLAELKRQRAAAKLQKRQAPAPPPLPPTQEETGAAQGGGAPEPNNRVYFTPASGDPPLLKLKAPEEEEPANQKEPCCGLM
ncbi:protein phosphatase 1 regulatory subunit 16A [Trichomycterus rosablanca]|uniref:protein phosphatase 1 regulatory subunit 16A n=1 Tax=Trichomycterus rosablanca TaxID=2290929 RepID=UPI002F35DE9E